MAQQIMASAMAHINEHIAFEYRKQVEMKMGVTLPSLLLQYSLLPSKQPEKVYGSEGYFKFDVEKTDKVGFCWKSENSSWNAEAKKIPQELAENFYNKLKKHKDVVSLQIQPDFMPSYLDGRDWLDTAKKLAALDAIVTIDTGVAHL